MLLEKQVENFLIQNNQMQKNFKLVMDNTFKAAHLQGAYHVWKIIA